jgi:hypothetical protein
MTHSRLGLAHLRCYSVASKKHTHLWLPISHALEETTFNFKTKDRKWGPAKPRGYEQPAVGDAVLWACQHAWSEYDNKTRTTKRHYCTDTLNHPEMWRSKNRGEFVERSANVRVRPVQTTAPATAQTATPTAAEKLAAARAMRAG